MIFRKASVVLFCFICFSMSAFGQAENEANSGSIYSYIGVGMPQLENSALERGMGIIGVSYLDIQNSGLANPALWGTGYFTRVSASLNYQKLDATEGNNVSSNTLLGVSQLHIVLPVKANKLGISAALYPSTRSSYSSFFNIENISAATDTLDYTINKSGTGGVSKLEFGISWRVNNNFSIGYAPSLAFLSTTDTEILDFQGNNLANNELETLVNGSGIGHRFGIVAGFQNILQQRDLLQFGAAVTLPVNITASSTKNTIRYTNSVRESINIEEIEEQDISLPLQISSGLSYFLSNKFNFSFEGMYQRWSEAKYEFRPDEQLIYNDRLFISFGGQYHPYTTGSNKFLSKFKYSYGISYDTGHLNIQGEDISTLWFSSGLGILSPRTRSSFDLSFQYGIRNVTSSSLVDERIWSISLSVNLAELMFVRPKLN